MEIDTNGVGPVQSWDVEPVDTTGLGVPPTVTWRIEDGVMLADDLPFRFSIRVTMLDDDSAGRGRHRVLLKRGDHVVADVVQTQHPHRDPAHDEPAHYAAGFASGLFWSAWRMTAWRAERDTTEEQDDER